MLRRVLEKTVREHLVSAMSHTVYLYHSSRKITFVEIKTFEGRQFMDFCFTAATY